MLLLGLVKLYNYLLKVISCVKHLYLRSNNLLMLMNSEGISLKLNVDAVYYYKSGLISKCDGFKFWLYCSVLFVERFWCFSFVSSNYNVLQITTVNACFVKIICHIASINDCTAVYHKVTCCISVSKGIAKKFDYGIM